MIKDGVITVNAEADGLQAHNDSDLEKGYIVVEGGTCSTSPLGWMVYKLKP